MPPAEVWRKRLKPESIRSVRDEKAFLIDFLPVTKRTVGRAGFVIDHIAYYSDILKPWIAARDRLGKFVIRRDPRDLSCVWVLDPVSNQYFELPYRSMSNPSVTLWEHRKAVERLRTAGKAAVDEISIFRMIDKMRAIVDEAEKNSKRARKEKARRHHLALAPARQEIEPPRKSIPAQVKKFDEIEAW